MNTIRVTLAVFAFLMMLGCDPAAAAPRFAKASADPGPAASSSGPLAYTVHRNEGFALATFNDWETTAGSDEQGVTIRSHPRGRQDDFSLIVYIAPLPKREQATFLETGPADFARAIPGMSPRGSAQPATFGGDAGRVAEYDVTGDAAAAAMGPGPRTARAAFVRKGDVGVVVFASGTQVAMRELGRAVDIVAGSIAFTESPIDPALVGTWANSGSTSSGRGAGMMSLTWETRTTFYRDGTFRESSTTIGSADVGTVSGDRGKAGRVVRRGETLTLHYEDGSVRITDYAVKNGTLTLFGKRWTRGK